MHFSGDTVNYLVSDGELASFVICALLVTQTVACVVSAGELAWFFMCTLLVTLWPVLFQPVSWPDHHMHISGDTGLVSAGELACSFIWTFLVIQTVASLVLEGELA